MREERKEVLVVGAGPVGLWTAFQLASTGVEVKIIDSENRTTARSYACALHPSTLALLDQDGLVEDLIANGRKVEKVAFYDGDSRQAEIKIGAGGQKFPFLLILPQSTLETTLEEHLKRRGVEVQWMHRLDSFTQEQETVAANVEELRGTSTGYVVPHWETTVRKELPMRVQFVVGADGNHSITRRRLKIEYYPFSSPQAFAAYEFEGEEISEIGAEVRVVLSDDSTSVLWPLPQNKWRWTFQILPSEGPSSFPEKERQAVRMLDATRDERIRDYVQRVAAKRAPWFTTQVKDVTWCTKVAFEQRLATSFGQGRCWLAGDAAHQTGPAGVQSMNSGFAEGTMLAAALKSIIHESGDMSLLKDYNVAQRKIWTGLMGPNAQLKPEPQTTPWITKRTNRLLPCLPGLGSDLDQLAAQLGLKR